MNNQRRKSTRQNFYLTNEINALLRTEKIQNIRHQLDEVISSACNERAKRSPRCTKLSPLINEQNSPSLRIRDSSNDYTKKNPFQNNCLIQADGELLAYKKFISSLTRIVQDLNPNTPDSLSLSPSFNDHSMCLGTQKRPVEENETFLIQKDLGTGPYIYKKQGMCETQHAEKTTYCRPVSYSQELNNKILENNAQLHQLVKKLVQARKVEKQNDAWSNYINELKTKHGYCHCQNKSTLNFIDQENERSETLSDENYVIKHTWKQNLCDHVLNDINKATNSNDRDIINIQNSDRCNKPSTSKLYKYGKNNLCCPMASQGRLMMLNKQGCCHRQPRYFRGFTIVTEKRLPSFRESDVMKSYGTIKSHRRSWHYRAMQTESNSPEPQSNSEEIETLAPEKKTDSQKIDSEPEIKPKETESQPKLENCSKNECAIPKNSKMSAMKIKYQQVNNIAEKIKKKISREDVKKNSLVKIEHKLDKLMESFNSFMQELKSKHVLKDTRSRAASCTSINKMNNTLKVKAKACNVLTKQTMLCDVAQQKTLSTGSFAPCAINQDTINDILNEEKDKSDQIKKDIDKILSTKQCAVQITIDIPTKEHSTEVTSSFCKRQQEETIVEEIEPIESEELEKIKPSMTIAVNTDPMGILALCRVSAEIVKQILSYVPNLDYVTYLARRQLENSNAAARYVCNICSATFSRPSALSDHIQGHNIDNTK